MNIVITGGTGFVGRHLVERFVKEGARVTVIARGMKEPGDSLENKAKFCRIDISDYAALQDAVTSLGNIDILFHLAACIDYAAGKEILFRINVKGTQNLLRIAARQRIGKFVYVSSIEAMGPAEHGDIPCNEDYPCRPATVYGQSKLEAEKQVIAFTKEENLNSVILRLSNVYGPGSLSFIAPVSKAIVSADTRYLLAHRQRYLWHPVYIDDAVEGIIKAGISKEARGVYILAGGEVVTVGDLARVISALLGVDTDRMEPSAIKNVRVVLKETARKVWGCISGDCVKRIHWGYSIEKARQELGYCPEISLKDGIKMTLQWARKEGIL